MKQTLTFLHQKEGTEKGKNKLHSTMYDFVVAELQKEGYMVEKATENPMVTLHTKIIDGRTMSFKVCVKTERSGTTCFADASYGTPKRENPQDFLSRRHKQNFRNSLPEIRIAIAEALVGVMVGFFCRKDGTKKQARDSRPFFLLQKDAGFVGGK